MADFNPSQYEQQNPLKKYFRTPKVYVTLPSQGKYYPPGAIEMPENGELPVFAMTAKDELAIKTPDALLNGQSTVDVIQSCVPAIKNAWGLPSVDLDAVLIAIRIATYGETLDLHATVPNTDIEKTYSVDLRKMLNRLVTCQFEDVVQIENFEVTLRPLNYKEYTEAALKTFEEQRIFALVNDDDMGEAEKLSKFGDSFRKLTELTVFTITKSIVKIKIEDEEVTNPLHIEEFIANVDKSFYTSLSKHLDKQKEMFSTQPLEISSTDEEVEAGAPSKWTLPVVFDQSNFFA